MKVAHGLLLLAALAAVPGPTDPVVRAGVVATLHGRSVLAMIGSPLVAGARLTLVTPDTPQAVLKARVVRPLSTEPDMSVRTPGPYYEVVSAEDGRTLPDVAVAMIGDPPVKRVAGAVSLQLDKTLQDVRVRVCRSMEGLHLTLWSGEPLKTPRVWHLYYYVGYDLQQTCQPGDTAAGGR